MSRPYANASSNCQVNPRSQPAKRLFTVTSPDAAVSSAVNLAAGSTLALILHAMANQRSEPITLVVVGVAL